MLQLQYYNAKLTKKHIDNILNNFNIKYSTIKNEIDAKLNSLLKIFMEDILSFLENIEEITKERKKIKEFENMKREYDILNLKYKEKTLNERKLESNIESLQKEITFLKNEKQANKQKHNLAESKTPTAHKNKTFRGIFPKKKDLKNQTDSLNTTSDNITYSSSKNNVFVNPINNTAKKFVNTTNIINSKLSQIKEVTNKRKKKESIMIKNEKSYNSRSPDIALVKKKIKTDSKGNFDKTIEKIKKYNQNRNNLKIQKIQKSKFGIKKNKTKINGDSNAFILRYNNKKTKYANKKVKEKEKEEDNINKNKTYEGVEEFLALIESPVDKNVKTNNYSEDDDNHSKKKNNNDESFSSNSISSDSNDSESFDEEIKELEEDENNILNIIKEIKELNTSQINA
jgi:hypothetical protein